MHSDFQAQSAVVASALVVSLALSQLTGCRSQAPDPRLDASRAAAQELGGKLKARLTAAMTQGGVEAAVAVCSEQAPAIAAGLSAHSGARVGRTALRYRNPDNAPVGWQREVMEDFEAQLAASAEPPEYAAVTRDGGYRYMKAIPTAPMCLACHGDVPPGPLADALVRLYPGDQAVGFKAGDLRGAFVVEWPP